MSESVHGAVMKVASGAEGVGRARLSLGVTPDWACSVGWCEREYRSHELTAVDERGAQSWSPPFGLAKALPKPSPCA